MPRNEGVPGSSPGVGLTTITWKHRVSGALALRVRITEGHRGVHLGYIGFSRRRLRLQGAGPGAAAATAAEVEAKADADAI